MWFIYFIDHEVNYKSISNKSSQLENTGSIKITADSKPESKFEGETDVSEGSVKNQIILIEIILEMTNLLLIFADINSYNKGNKISEPEETFVLESEDSDGSSCSSVIKHSSTFSIYECLVYNNFFYVIIMEVFIFIQTFITRFPLIRMIITQVFTTHVLGKAYFPLWLLCQR